MIPWWGCFLFTAFGAFLGYIGGAAIARQQVMTQLFAQQVSQTGQKPGDVLGGLGVGNASAAQREAPRG